MKFIDHELSGGGLPCGLCVIIGLVIGIALGVIGYYLYNKFIAGWIASLSTQQEEPVESAQGGGVYLGEIEQSQNVEHFNAISDCGTSKFEPNLGTQEYCDGVTLTQIFLVYLKNMPNIYPSEKPDDINSEEAGRTIISLYLNGEYMEPSTPVDENGNAIALADLAFDIGIDCTDADGKTYPLADVKKSDGVETDCGIQVIIDVFKDTQQCKYTLNINQNEITGIPSSSGDALGDEIDALFINATAA